MKDYIQTYKDLHLEFDAIATGFLGSEKQVDIVIDFIQTFKKDNSFILVDPVMEIMVNCIRLILLRCVKK